ncbi:oxidoreductase [Amycolatopsis mediterranei S699]|uniref:Oxidoreductase n=2 Tax=Amycolatopsis mediterranei TaxID=33910 RepID=A0A0H3D532_AMYMU|nr:Gfo/Idh/MocA family oxidoreductase [Amycolatopsis mediterranei]ADJ45756.1 oxidoreductase [Amycolatopsis mediterranei U32]AEK42536.1 oxidoreductase [Amycolatopsis mediterranei S699]AFO77467.1 oxidoreductase [Amycolatopsis mediterranei S699]AGT84595.1 oxidoreductase [Amycolatopsis mediterranei RB]KDO05292.1 dehydrogenase [Amycolatopsis mediterranei]
MSPGRETIGIGMVGHAFMGAVHSHAWRSVHRFFDPPLVPRLAVLGGRDEARAKAAAEKFGWDAVETDWRKLVARDDVGLVDVCTPGDSHAEIAIAALEAGKHVLCEKPLANSVAEAEAMAEAARRARERGVRAMVAFNYRRVPALAHARKLVASGALGEIRHVRSVYLQDWLSDPQAPMTWRLRRESAGSGALGDLGAHIVDAAQFVTGEVITGVSALTNTFVKQRPSESGGTDAVTVDDTALFLARLSGGAVASFEATRFALGRKNAMRLEVNGSKASLAFDFEAMNELQWYEGTGTEAGFRRILVTEPQHPYVGAWWPPGHLLGYEHTFTHEVADLLDAIGAGTDPAPSFDDGLRVQRVLAAVETSAAAEAQWTPVEEK